MAIVGDHDDINCLYSCDRCGKVHSFDESGWEIQHEFWALEIFAGVSKNWLNEIGDLCKECAKEVTPLIYNLRDIWELRIFVNKLEREVNENRRKSTKNNGSAKDNACKCCERCDERALGYRQGIGATQVGEEHY